MILLLLAAAAALLLLLVSIGKIPLGYKLPQPDGPLEDHRHDGPGLHGRDSLLTVMMAFVPA